MGSPRRSASGSFRSRSGARAPDRPSQAGDTHGFILLCRFSLIELLRRPPAPRLSAPELHLPGFRPYSRLRRKRPLFARFASPRFVPSSGFRNLSTICSAFRFAGLSHPAATSRVFPFRDLFPIRSACRLVAGSCPLAVGRPLPRLLFGSRSNGPFARRNEPASTSGHPDFEASFHGSIARLRFPFRSAVGRFPSAGSSSSRCSPPGS